jgi:hypothetical protein
MFKQNKWEVWYDNLPSHTKTWLKNQPVWHDIDLAKAFLIGIIIGLIFGMVL